MSDIIETCEDLLATVAAAETHGRLVQAIKAIGILQV